MYIAKNVQFLQEIQQKIVSLEKDINYYRTNLINNIDDRNINDINTRIKYIQSEINNLKLCITGIERHCPSEIMQKFVSKNSIMPSNKRIKYKTLILRRRPLIPIWPP